MKIEIEFSCFFMSARKFWAVGNFLAPKSKPTVLNGRDFFGIPFSCHKEREIRLTNGLLREKLVWKVIKESFQRIKVFKEDVE